MGQINAGYSNIPEVTDEISITNIVGMVVFTATMVVLIIIRNK